MPDLVMVLMVLMVLKKPPNPIFDFSAADLVYRKRDYRRIVL